MWHRIGWVWHCIEGVYTKARCRECMDRWAWHCLCKDHGKVEGGAWNCIEGVALRRGCGVLSFRSVGGVFGVWQMFVEGVWKLGGCGTLSGGVLRLRGRGFT